MLRGTLWLGVYIQLIVLPLVVAAIWPGESGGRPFLTQLGVAFGYTGFTVMALEFALIAKIQSVSSAFGQDALLQFHRQMGLVATLLILLHAAILLYSGYPLEWLNPLRPDSPWAMRWGVMSTFTLLLLIGVSSGRKQLRIAYGWWQLTHGLLAELTIVAALVHQVLFAGFSDGTPMRILLAGYGALVLSLRAWFQYVKPYQLWSQPWEVVENIEELGDTRTLVLRPVGHAGFIFEPGQFAWLSTGRTPFQKDRHPISMSSAAYDEPGPPIAFTIKNLGDWSGTVVPALKPGSRVWVDGPYGVFTPDREQGPGYVLVGGGAGITPLYSICRTFAERGDLRPVYLFFASRAEDRLIFRRQLDELQTKMNLHLIYTLESPPAHWTGETGYITAAMLRKHLPPQHHRYQHFLCGPEPMVEAMEVALSEMGVPSNQIHTERFAMV